MNVVDIVLLALPVIANLALLSFVYIRNPRSATHRLFALLTLILSIWSVINAFSVGATTPMTATWLVRLVICSGTALSVVFLLLMHTFPRSTMLMSRRGLFIWLALMSLTMAATLSPLVFTRVDLVPGVAPQPHPGPGMILFVPVSIGTIPLGFYYLIRKMLKAKGRERVQIRFLFLGVFTMYALIIGLTFILVNVFNNTFFVTFSPLFTLPFTILTAYSIVRYRLMDIRGAVFRVFGFTLLSGTFFILFGVIIYLLNHYFHILDLDPIYMAVIGALGLLVAVPSFNYFREILKRVTDRFLFQNRIDYKKALVDLGQDLAATIKIEEVTAITQHVMEDIIRSRKGAILLQENEGGKFIPRAFYGFPTFNISIPNDNALLQHLRHAPGAVVKDELSLLLERDISAQHQEEITALQNAITWLDVSVIIPLFVNKELTGVILLGDKESGEPYLQDDIEFLNALAPQAATALENARLYKESLEFGQRLRDEVEAATKELATANTQLKELDKAKSEFLSIASHQLYTPLTALRGYISMLQEGDFGAIPDKQKEVLDILTKSANRLIDLIKNLLDISRIESGRLELNLESVDLVSMAKELVQDLLPNAINKGLKLEFVTPDQPLPHVVADQQRIRQVMLNFIDNAIKYTPQGWVHVFLQQEGDDVTFSVQDSGKGISQAEITQLFNKFTRVGGASRFHTEGTGLGLYVAKQIVREHRGDVAVDSPGKDQGSTFSMRLPIEGAARSLKLGDKASVVIKAADASGKPG